MITTFLSREERQRLITVTDKDVNEEFQQVRNLSKRFFLRETIIGRRRGLFLKRTVELKYYDLYYQPFEHLDEVQCINFFMPSSGTSINTIVPKEIILAWCFGFCGGVKEIDHRAKMMNKPAKNDSGY